MEILHSVASLLVIPAGIAILLFAKSNNRPALVKERKSRKSNDNSRVTIRIRSGRRKVRFNIHVRKEFTIDKWTLIKLLITIALCLGSFVAH